LLYLLTRLASGVKISAVPYASKGNPDNTWKWRSNSLDASLVSDSINRASSDYVPFVSLIALSELRKTHLYIFDA
jgi:hypothetical protein